MTALGLVLKAKYLAMSAVRYQLEELKANQKNPQKNKKHSVCQNMFDSGKFYRMDIGI